MEKLPVTIRLTAMSIAWHDTVLTRLFIECFSIKHVASSVLSNVGQINYCPVPRPALCKRAFCLHLNLTSLEHAGEGNNQLELSSMAGLAAWRPAVPDRAPSVSPHAPA